jgi:hypothetical protein
VANNAAAPVFPPGRYGRRRAPGRTRRWVPVALLLPVVLAMLLLAGYLYRQYGDPPYRVTVQSQGGVTDTSATVTFTVHKRDGGPALCRVRAKTYNGAEVGYADVPVPAGTDVTVHYTVTTSARPYAVDVLGCHAA